FRGAFDNLYGNAGNPLGEVDSSSIKGIRFVLNPGFASFPKAGGAYKNPYNAAFGANGTSSFYIDYIYIGAAPTSFTTAESNLVSSMMYPNPANDKVNIQLILNSVSDVKINITDLTGKELLSSTETNVSELNASLDVSSLHTGTYMVNYIVNGMMAKSELLLK
ncbi:MAG: T9SS type A sorting domain-containing protein, partial [Cytophagaceae bacterium]|nr:T9SS type A sorting domain-containing protein [Cytophagaceae bacterium]MDW8456830.1 T9SS type A sorting domain-containing protein [Cytophagaceae bacterium]